MELREKLIALSVLKNGNWFKMYDVLKDDLKLKQITQEQVTQAKLKLGESKVLTVLDEEYPSLFKEMIRPPFVLYYQGDLMLLKKKKIGVMGNRRPSAYGMESCKAIVGNLLSQDVAIVGNLQLGIDAIAHLLSVRSGKTIALLSSGFLHVYPQENFELYKRIARDHLVMTEYPPHVYPSAPQFYRAHQLVQELSEVMVVIEAVKEDKRLKLAQQLVEEGKVVYALPAPYNSIHSEGSLNLLKNGAYCLTHYQDVLNMLDWVHSEE